MSKKQKIMRFMISGVMLAAVALVGISVYQIDMSQQEKQEELNELAQSKDDAADESEVLQGGNSTASLDEVQPHHAVIDGEEEEIPESEHVTSNDVTAQTEDSSKENQKEASADDVISKGDEKTINAPTSDKKDETLSTDNKSEEVKKEETSASSAAIVPTVDFTGELLMNWPVEGIVLMDYSMDRSVYFETLNVYKYNPSVLLKAEVGTPVEAAANMKILSVEESLETGVTISADMGNGYHAIYGQLKDVMVHADDVVAAGTVLGYVQEPTKYYTKEGANLYFAMTKDGEYIDPVLYLP